MLAEDIRKTWERNWVALADVRMDAVVECVEQAKGISNGWSAENVEALSDELHHEILESLSDCRAMAA